jgi:tetratricopeptide (TPR) repeat protein
VKSSDNLQEIRMTNISRHRYIAINLLALLVLSPFVSLGQTTSKPADPDLLLSLPNANTVLVIDAKRVINEALPRLLADEPTLRPLVVSLLDLKAHIGIDLQAIERVAIGVRLTQVEPGTNDPGFNVVIIARSSEAARVPAILRQMGPTKFREQQHGGKTLFVEKAEPPVDSRTTRSELAISTLNENTIVLGDVAEVRTCIDVSAGKANGISQDHIAALKRNPKAVLNAVSQLPPAFASAVQQIGSPEVSDTFSSLEWLYGSVELSTNGFEVAVTALAASPEQAKKMADIFGALKTVSTGLAAGKTPREKVVRELIHGLTISTDGNELQVRAVVTQAMLDSLARQFASDFYVGNGLAQMDLSNPEAAIAEYDKAIMLNADEALPFLNRGKANADKGNLDAAIADYDKAIALEPGWALAYNNRGFARIRREEFDAAIVDLDKAIALDPTFGFAYNNRGKAFAEKGDLEKAMADYDKSIALDASNALALSNRGYARTLKGEFDGAIADFDRAIAVSPKMAESYNGRGAAYYTRYFQSRSAQDLNKAIDDYSQAINLGPAAMIYANRGYALTDKEEYDRAIADFDKALTLNPKLATAYNGRGLVNYSKAQFAQAIVDYDKAIAFDANSAEFYGNRALSRLALRLDEAAAKDLKKCYELDDSVRAIYEPAVKEIKKTRRPKRRP